MFLFQCFRLGEHDRNRREGSEEDIKVERIITHPSWNRRTMNNDIALMKLSKPAKMGKYVLPVCLPSGDVTVGTECYITGITCIRIIHSHNVKFIELKYKKYLW